MKVNSQRKTVAIWLVIAVIGVVVVFLPGILGIDGFDGGFALSALGILIVIVGVVVAITYARRASKLDAVFEGKDLLAHWTYTSEEWQSYTENENREQKADKKKLFLLVAVIAIVIGIGFLVFDRENGKYGFFACLGIIVIIAPFAFLPPLFDYRRNKKRVGEAYIARNGVYLNQVFHNWDMMGARLDSVVYEEEPRWLLFTYSAPTRAGMATYNVRVPVPHGQEAVAGKIAEELNG